MRTSAERTIHRSQKKPLCFRSDERYFCRRRDCPLRADCFRLIAEWHR